MTRVLGPDHPHTLRARGNLALVLYAQGRLGEAETENGAALQTMTRVLGADHPYTLTTRGNLALVLRDRERLEEAEAERAAPPPGTILLAGRRVALSETSARNTQRAYLVQYPAPNGPHRLMWGGTRCQDLWLAVPEPASTRLGLVIPV